MALGSKKKMKISPVLQLFIGILGGLIVPIVFGWIFLTSFYGGEITFEQLHLLLSKFPSLIVNLLIVAVLPNMLAVFILNYFELWNYCRGVFVAIMLYIAVAVLI